jgi:protease-4
MVGILRTMAEELKVRPRESKSYWQGTKEILGKILRFLRRGWLGVTSAVGSLVLFFLIFGFFGGVGIPASPLGKAKISEEYITGEGEDKIAMVSLSGLIVEEAAPGLFSGGTRLITPEGVREFLTQANEDENVGAVILTLSSPGGSAVASDRIWEEIAGFEKPTVVLMGDTVASGGYFIASAADKIVASPATLTGSIGVIAEIYNLADLYEKLGVKVEVFKKGEYKDILSSARERTREEEKMLDELLSDAYDLFLKRVSGGRGLEIEKVRELAEGKIYSGEKALKVGLVDEIGSFQDAVEVAKDLAGIEKVKVFEYSRISIWESLFGGMGVSILGRIFPARIDSYPRVMYLLEI